MVNLPLTMVTPVMLGWSDTQWKNAIRRNRVFLLRNMGMTGLLDYMVQHNMIGTCAYEEHLSFEDQPESKRVDKMLNYLSRRPAKDFVKLMRYFEESQQHHIIERLAQGTEASNPEPVNNDPPTTSRTPTWDEWQSTVPAFRSENAAAAAASRSVHFQNMESIQLPAGQDRIETVWVSPVVKTVLQRLIDQQNNPKKEMTFCLKILDLCDEKAPENTTSCSICMDNKPNIVLLPCGHCSSCKTCFIKHITGQSECIFTLHNFKCFICRTPVEKAQPIYM